MKLSELAAKVEAQLENYTTDVEIRGVAPVEEAEVGQIAYVGSPAEWRAAKHSDASALITMDGLTGSAVPRLCGEDPYLLFARVVEIFHTPLCYEEGIHSTAVIHESARIGPNASIGAYVVIDRDVAIGAHAVLLPHVVIYRGARIGKNFFAHAHAVVRESCRLGDNVVLQNGAVIGSDGFGFVKEAGGNGATWKKVLHTGSVILGDDVEVQSNACINRSDDGDTHIGAGVKIGDLVHVAHKASVAACSLVLPQVALAGRARVGKNVIIAGQAGVAGNCEIADDAVVMSQSGVIGHIGAGKVVSGFPAICHKDFLRSFAVFKRLPELTQGLRRASSGCSRSRGRARKSGERQNPMNAEKIAAWMEMRISKCTDGNRTFFETEAFPWVRSIEAHWLVIRKELDALLEHKEEIPNLQDVSPEQSPIAQGESWKSFFLYGFGHMIERNCARCPETASRVTKIPGLKMAMFSILAPRSHIPSHRGPYKGLLRYHLGLMIPTPSSSCRLRVADEVRSWQEGKSLIFDDSYSHEAWNDSDYHRVVLFVDFVRPFALSLVDAQPLGHLADLEIAIRPRRGKTITKFLIRSRVQLALL